MSQRFLVLFALFIVVSGCASTQQNPSLTNQLQTRVADLEQQLQAKNEEVDSLKSQVKDLAYEADRAKMQASRSFESSRPESTGTVAYSGKSSSGDIIRVSASPDQVQTALKNAGYYQGVVDGRIGAKTKEAISRFQKDRGLKADGIIGKRTWDELKTHLE